MARRVTIDVLGRKFTFETQADEERANEVARFVSERVDGVQKALGATSGGKDIAIIVLAAMGIASDFFALKDDHDQLVQTVKARSRKLLSNLGEGGEIEKERPGEPQRESGA